MFIHIHSYILLFLLCKIIMPKKISQVKKPLLLRGQKSMKSFFQSSTSSSVEKVKQYSEVVKDGIDKARGAISEKEVLEMQEDSEKASSANVSPGPSTSLQKPEAASLQKTLHCQTQALLHTIMILQNRQGESLSNIGLMNQNFQRSS